MNYQTKTMARKADSCARTRCERAIDLMLTSRGDPSAEIDRVLAENPEFVFGH